MKVGRQCVSSSVFIYVLTVSFLCLISVYPTNKSLFFKVVDMTGPETKILSGYSSIGQQHAKPEEVGSHPGLQCCYLFITNLSFVLV